MFLHDLYGLEPKNGHTDFDERACEDPPAKIDRVILCERIVTQ
jgi:hypothetical protein